MNERYTRPLNLEQFRKRNGVAYAGQPLCLPPLEEQYVLRVLVKAPHTQWCIPEDLRWLGVLVDKALAYQSKRIGVRHPYCYITVRHGSRPVETGERWHVDGFSMRYHHLPEANYVWVVSEHPTQFVQNPVVFPEDFDPLKHSVHKFLARRAEGKPVYQVRSGHLYLFDPYVLHRRPAESSGEFRTFVRISFTPIEINDRNNTPNPAIPTPHYVLDGRAFYESLEDYDLTRSPEPAI